MATNTERMRRSRAHKRGDHSLCLPERLCRGGDVAPPVTPQHATASDDPPPGLRARGRWLWGEMIPGQSWSSAQRVMIQEACRLADRMDQLDRLLSGDIATWARLHMPDTDLPEVIVTVDRALGEARQHAATYKQILAELRQAGKPVARRAQGASAAAPAGKGGAGIADITARIAERRSQTAR